MLNDLHDPADIVVAFVNTADVEAGTDQLATLQQWQDWSDSPATEAELVRARELRAWLRRLLGEPDDATTAQATVELPVSVVLSAQTVRLGAPDPVGRIACAVATLAIEGRMDRLKICPADDCRWAFYDKSKNRSRQWCSMQVCGNRAKVRNHRERAGA